jgi:hypothetical protein
MSKARAIRIRMATTVPHSRRRAHRSTVGGRLKQKSYGAGAVLDFRRMGLRRRRA